MKKFYVFLTLALALIGVGAAWAGYVAIVGESGVISSETELKAGDVIAFRSATKTTLGYVTVKDDNGTKIIEQSSQQAGDAQAFILEASGTKISGLDAFYLKNAATGLYLYNTGVDLNEANHPADPSIELEVGLTAEKANANAFIIFNAGNHRDISGYTGTTEPDGLCMMFGTNVNGETVFLNWVFENKLILCYNDYATWFTITRMREGAGAEVAMQQLQQLLSDVANVTYLDTDGPGSYDKDLVATFKTAKQEASALNGSAEATEADLLGAIDALNNAWAALKAATPKPMAEGYYFMISAAPFWNAEGVYKRGVYTGGVSMKWYAVQNEYGYDAENPNYVWKFTKVEGTENYTIQSLGQQVYIKKGFSGTGNKLVTLTKEAEEAATFTVKAGAISGAFAFGMNDIVGQKNDAGEAGSEMGENKNFLHAVGHGGGSGTNDNVGFWTEDAVVSQWYLIPLSAEKLEELDEIGKQRNRTNTFTELLNKAQTASDAAHVWVFGEDITPKDANAYDSNAGMSVDHGLSWTAETAEAGGIYGKDGQGFSALYDGSAATFFHTTWKTQPKENDEFVPHFLTVELTKAASKIQLHFLQRGGGGASYNTPSAFKLEASNDGTTWTEVAAEVKGYDASAIEIHIPAIDLKASYKHIKMSVLHTVGRNGTDLTAGDSPYPYWNLSGLTITLGDPTLDPACQAATMPADVVKGLEDALTTAAAVDKEKATDADITALQGAYDAFMAQFADPTELKNAIAAAETKSKGFLATDQLGGNGAGATNNLPAAIETAQAVLNAAYTEASLKTALEALNRAVEAFDATLITTPDETKWYQIRVSDAETKAKFGWTYPEASHNGKVMAICPSTTEFYQLPNLTEGSTTIWARTPEELSANQAEGLSYFRFIKVADGEYYLQNKTTGRFIRFSANGVTSKASAVPTLFKIETIGCGQVHVVALDFSSKELAPLHLDASGFLTTWSTKGLNTRSALEVVPVASETVNKEDIGANVPATMDFLQGKWYPTTFISSVKNLTNTKIYKVSGYADEGDGNYSIGFLEATDKDIEAGEPVILVPGSKTFVNKDTYTDADSCSVAYLIGTEAVREGKNVNGFQATFVALTAEEGNAIISQDDETEGKLNVVTKETAAKDKSVAALTAYFKLLTATVTDLPEADANCEIWLIVTGGDLVSIKNARVALKNKTVYNLNGMRMDVNNLKAGQIYIINGRKVLIP